jgi:ketosteroid isomerase-like protein
MVAAFITMGGGSFASECPGLSPENKIIWEAALKRADEAQAIFVRGDPAPIKSMWAKTDDVTLFVAFGGYERGWDQVGPRLDWGARQFSPPASDSTGWRREHVSVQICDGVSTTVQIERFTARAGPAKQERQFEVRATLIWRKDADGWRIVHRHGDALTPRAAPQPN